MGGSGITLVLPSFAPSPLIPGIPLAGREASVMAKVLQKVAPFHSFEWISTEEEQWPGPDAKVAVAFGDEAFRIFAGKFTGIEKARGYRYEGLDGTPVIPTFDPSVVARGKMNLIPVLIYDLLSAQNEIGKPAPEYPTGQLTLYPSREGMEEWCQDALDSEFVSVDLETPYTKDLDEEQKMEAQGVIIRASLALDEAHGFRAITFPWEVGYIDSFYSIMQEPMDKVFHNGWDFDLPKLAEAGIKVKGTIQDTMWLFHSLQPTLPRGLGSITPYYARLPEWKSMSGSDPELYSALDAYATSKCFVGIRKAMQSRRLA